MLLTFYRCGSAYAVILIGKIDNKVRQAGNTKLIGGCSRNIFPTDSSQDLLQSGRARCTAQRVALDDNVVVNSVHAGLLILWLGGLDDLVEGGKEAESSEPPHETLGGIDVLAVKVQTKLGSDTIVPDGVDVLDELLSGSCVGLAVVE